MKRGSRGFREMVSPNVALTTADLGPIAAESLNGNFVLADNRTATAISNIQLLAHVDLDLVNMVFIMGINFPETRLVKRSLEIFYGVGPLVSQRLMARFHIHPTAKVGSLANKQVLDLTAELSSMTIENDLRRQLRDNIKRLRDMGSYRGRRHALGLPVRGQRTRTQTATANKLNKVERRG
ncbi:hypothetical protein MMC08_009099 [Hypocenomyce scalaris]|nr:hypothetical protein [Hypocenomyce scalaris]